MIYYFFAGAAYAVIWIMYHEMQVREISRAMDEKLESNHVHDKRFYHVIFMVIMLANITVFWPVKLCRDLKGVL